LVCGVISYSDIVVFNGTHGGNVLQQHGAFLKDPDIESRKVGINFLLFFSGIL